MADKLEMKTANISQYNVGKIKALFPNAVTEVIKDGKATLAIDFDVLKQELSESLISEGQERYQLTWPDKKKSVVLANSAISAALRPCKEESVDFENTQNLYIEGDNLDVLKLLRETYLGKVDVIYIDPPYNTGNDILYKNDYSKTQIEFDDKYETDEVGNRLYINTDSNGRFHTDWMNMMYQRIRIAKDLLSKSGFFLLAIDHNELFNIGEICDEIFGYANRIGVISVIHKPEGRNQAKFIGPSNEFMLVYAKNEQEAKLQNVVLDPEVASKFHFSDEKGNYRLQNFIRMTDGKLAYRSVRPKFWYPIYVDTIAKKLSTDKNKLTGDIKEIYPVTKVGVEMSWKVLPNSAQALIDNGELSFDVDKDGFITILEKIRETQIIKTHWMRKEYNAIQYGTKIVNELLGANLFDFPKSLYLIEDVIKLFCPKDGLILDFFSGSATTAHATMLLNSKDYGKRKYICVQIPASCDVKSEAYKAGYKNICEIGKERIRRAGKKIKFECGMLSNSLDLGFRVFKLDSSNMQDVYYNPSAMSQNLLDTTIDNVKPDRTPMDLLFQVFLVLGVELSSKVEERELKGKKYYIVNDNDIIACFDDDLNNEVITEIAKLQPLYAVFKDKSFASDSVGINNEQIFKTYAPGSTVKVL